MEPGTERRLHSTLPSQCCVVGENIHPRARQSLGTVWPWAIYSTLLCFGVLIWKCGSVIAPIYLHSPLEIRHNWAFPQVCGGTQQNSFHGHIKEPPRKELSQMDSKKRESSWQFWLNWSPQGIWGVKKEHPSIECFPFSQFFTLILAHDLSFFLCVCETLGLQANKQNPERAIFTEISLKLQGPQDTWVGGSVA